MLPRRGTPTSAQGAVPYDASSNQQPSSESNGHSNPAAQQNTTFSPAYAQFLEMNFQNQPNFPNHSTHESLAGQQAGDFNTHGADSDLISSIIPVLVQRLRVSSI